MKNLGEVTRHSIQVQLEAGRGLDAAIIERVRELKAKRKFTATFRDMASLYFSLQEGDTSVLAELFPWIVGVITAGDSTDDSGNGGNEAVLNKLETLQRAIEAQQPGGHYQAPAAAPQMVSGNISGLKPLPPPMSDDDIMASLEVKEADRSEVNATQNFINSLMALQNVTSPKSGEASKPSKSVKRERRSLDDLIEVKTAGSV